MSTPENKERDWHRIAAVKSHDTGTHNSVEGPTSVRRCVQDMFDSLGTQTRDIRRRSQVYEAEDSHHDIGEYHGVPGEIAPDVVLGETSAASVH